MGKLLATCCLCCLYFGTFAQQSQTIYEKKCDEVLKRYMGIAFRRAGANNAYIQNIKYDVHSPNFRVDVVTQLILFNKVGALTSQEATALIINLKKYEKLKTAEDFRRDKIASQKYEKEQDKNKTQEKLKEPERVEHSDYYIVIESVKKNLNEWFKKNEFESNSQYQNRTQNKATINSVFDSICKSEVIKNIDSHTINSNTTGGYNINFLRNCKYQCNGYNADEGCFNLTFNLRNKIFSGKWFCKPEKAKEINEELFQDKKNPKGGVDASEQWVIYQGNFYPKTVCIKAKNWLGDLALKSEKIELNVVTDKSYFITQKALGLNQPILNDVSYKINRTQYSDASFVFIDDETQKIEEQKRKEQELEEQQRAEEQERLKKQEQQRIEEQKRKEQELEEQQRIEGQKRKEQELEEQRKAEEERKIKKQKIQEEMMKKKAMEDSLNLDGVYQRKIEAKIKELTPRSKYRDKRRRGEYGPLEFKKQKLYNHLKIIEGSYLSIGITNLKEVLIADEKLFNFLNSCNDVSIARLADQLNKINDDRSIKSYEDKIEKKRGVFLNL